MKVVKALAAVLLLAGLGLAQNAVPASASTPDTANIMQELQQLRNAVAAQQKQIQQQQQQIESLQQERLTQVSDAVAAVSPQLVNANLKTGSNAGGAIPTPVAQTKAAAPAGPPGPIAAIAPIRVLATPAKYEGVVPVLSIGKIRVQPYGLFKTTVVHDSSSPYGNDFPLPGFIGDINTVDKLSEFHLKARGLRLGTNFEWPDLKKNVVVTGKFEFDFEGNFTRVNNRNISSIRSSQPSLRLAYGRLDWATTTNTTVFVLAGQDWTPFASSTLPNLFETTGFGIGFGTLYERDPQIRGGFFHKFGGSRNFAIQPEVAVVLPGFGNLPSDIGNQLGYGERQGVDSAQPEIQGRIMAQFQLDKAKNVAPAQFIVSGMHGTRRAVVLASAVPAAFKAAFPTGAALETEHHGGTAEIQLPTRWFTLIGKYYNGTGLRWFFAGQVYAEFNDTIGMTGTATAPTIDGASTLVFGNRGGVPVLAAQQEPRAQGGFINLGIPLSRLANANPTGRNAGWNMYLHYGLDQVLARDVKRLGGGRAKGTLAAGQLAYKLNNYVTFAAEESLYTTIAEPLTATGNFPLFNGRPNRVWKDVRTEIGTVFTF